MRDSSLPVSALQFFESMADTYSPGSELILHESDPEPGRAVSDRKSQDFEVFFQMHRPALIAFLRRRTANEADAEELAQESYARLLGYEYDDSRPPEVWRALLYRIAGNLAVSEYRARRSQQTQSGGPLEEGEFVSELPSQERMIAAHQELAMIRQALAALSPKCRKVFMLSRAHHKTYPEIALMCAISTKMVEKYMSQALSALRRAVRKDA